MYNEEEMREAMIEVLKGTLKIIEEWTRYEGKLIKRDHQEIRGWSRSEIEGWGKILSEVEMNEQVRRKNGRKKKEK